MHPIFRIVAETFHILRNTARVFGETIGNRIVDAIFVWEKRTRFYGVWKATMPYPTIPELHFVSILEIESFSTIIENMLENVEIRRLLRHSADGEPRNARGKMPFR